MNDEITLPDTPEESTVDTVVPEEDTIAEPAQIVPDEEISAEPEHDAGSDVPSVEPDYGELEALYPGMTADDLPDSVKDAVSSGIPPAAAYSLYLRKKEIAAGIADEVNRKNDGLSFGLGKNTVGESYFSPDEVREMTRDEVRKNYDKIIDSMSHWH